jgi:MFS transporter, DHA1 family, tetracycline resistance protein
MFILFAIVLIDLIGFGIVIPLLPFYGTRFSASPFEVTLLMATYSLFQLFLAPVWGRLSDQYGRKPILLLSLAGSVASYLWLGFADAFWMLVAARAIQGACAGNIAAAQAYIADVTTPETRAKGMGLIGAAFGFGFIMGPFVGGTLAGSDPAAPMLAPPAFAAAGLSALAFLATVFFLKESVTSATRNAARQSRLAAVGMVMTQPRLRFLVLVFFVIIFAFAGMETTFALWAMAQFGWGPRPVTYIFAFVGVLGAVVQGGLIGRLVKRFGEERVLIAGTSLIVGGLILIPVSTTVPILLVATACLAVGMGMTQPSINSLISREAAAHQQGEVMGVAQSAGSLARVLGPAFAGFLFGAIGRNAPYIASAALMALVVILATRVAPALTPKAQPLP